MPGIKLLHGYIAKLLEVKSLRNLFNNITIEQSNNSMRISLIFFAITIGLFSLISYGLSSAFAQTSSLEKAKSDYSFQFTKYREIQKVYQSIKSLYESFKTATSKNEAFLKTKDYLEQIDNLLIAYVLLVNEGGSKVNWQSNPPEHSKITQSLQVEISYFKDHHQRVQ